MKNKTNTIFLALILTIFIGLLSACGSNTKKDGKDAGKMILLIN
jgi:hypothetical protein